MVELPPWRKESACNNDAPLSDKSRYFSATDISSIFEYAILYPNFIYFRSRPNDSCKKPPRKLSLRAFCSTLKLKNTTTSACPQDDGVASLIDAAKPNQSEVEYTAKSKISSKIDAG